MLFKIFRLYFDFLERLSKAIDPDYRRPKFLDLLVNAAGIERQNVTIDERIRKIDSARENLQDAISAIDELRVQADTNKRDLTDALKRIEDAEYQKQVIGEELNALKQVAETDTAAFRRIVGLPTKADVWRERLLGFGSGVLASTIASIIFFAAIKIFHVS